LNEAAVDGRAGYGHGHDGLLSKDGQLPLIIKPFPFLDEAFKLGDNVLETETSLMLWKNQRF